MKLLILLVKCQCHKRKHNNQVGEVTFDLKARFIYIYNSNPKLKFITEVQNDSYDVTVTNIRHWTITTQKSYLSLAANSITAKLTNQSAQTRLKTQTKFSHNSLKEPIIIFHLRVGGRGFLGEHMVFRGNGAEISRRQQSIKRDYANQQPVRGWGGGGGGCR